MARNRKSAKRRAINAQKEALAKIVAMNIALAAANDLNLEALQVRLRKHVMSARIVKQKVDVRSCPRLYNAPTIPSIDADYHMKNGEFRVCEEDGLKLY